MQISTKLSSRKRVSSSDDASMVTIFGTPSGGYYLVISDSFTAQEFAVTQFELKLLYKTLKKFYETHKDTQGTKKKKHD